MIHFAHLAHHLCRHLGVGAEAHATFLDIGARDIQLDSRNLLQLIDLRRHVAVFLDARAADVDNDIGV